MESGRPDQAVGLTEKQDRKEMSGCGRKIGSRSPGGM